MNSVSIDPNVAFDWKFGLFQFINDTRFINEIQLRI